MRTVGGATGQRPQLLLLDADGTTLDPLGRVSQATRQAVRQARSAGVRVVLCTGRLHGSAAAIAREAGVDDPVLSCNGALAVSLGQPPRVWWRDPLPREDIPTLQRVLDEFGCAFELYAGTRMYASRRSFRPWMIRSGSRLEAWRAWRLLRQIWRNLRLVQVRPLRAWSGVPEELPEKIMVSHPQAGRLGELEKALAEVLPGRLEIARSGEHYMEITRAGVNKGYGAARLAEALGIPREAVMAIGDQGNDLPMLRWAGLGVAMGNAPRQIREAADAVTGSNQEEGVSQAIQRFILAAGSGALDPDRESPGDRDSPQTR